MTEHLPPTILVVAPDMVFRTGISNCLERAGFMVHAVPTGDEALKLIDEAPEHRKPNMLVIEQNLEGLNGIEICSILRTKNNKQLAIILIADEESNLIEIKNEEKVFDEYLIKPFAQNDLINNVKSLLSKTRPTLLAKTLEYKDLKIDLASYKVTKSGREIHIGPTEFKILQCLLESPKKIFSRENLVHYVWGQTAVVELRTIDVHINRLRTALKTTEESTPFIKTVRAMGYCLCLPGID